MEKMDVKLSEQSEERKKPKRKDDDIFRDSNFRYLGYANEVGEAFRSWVSVGIVRSTYIAAITYVVMDAGAKMSDEWRVARNPNRYKESVKKGADVFLWQSLASVVIPGIAINRLVATTKFLVTKSSLPAPRIISTAVGLAAIPFIVHPIDDLVDKLMDQYVRPSLKNM